MKQQFLDLVKVVVDRDAAILSKIYPNAQRKIKLNNEVGMDWVVGAASRSENRNYYSFPEIQSPNLSRSS